MAELSIAIGVLGIGALTMVSTFRNTMSASMTADRKVDEVLLFKDAATVLSSPELCTAQIGVPTPIGAAPPNNPITQFTVGPTTGTNSQYTQQISLTSGCVPQVPLPPNGSGGVNPLPPGFAYTNSGVPVQVGICAGGTYDNRLHIASVSLENVQAIGASYAADVLIIGYKTGEVQGNNTTYGTNTIARTLKAIFNGTPGAAPNGINNCLGSQVASPQNVCTSLSGLWINGQCNLCNYFKGVWSQKNNTCLIGGSICDLPAGAGWIGANNYTECNTAADVLIPNGVATTLPDVNTSSSGQATFTCTNGNLLMSAPSCIPAACNVVTPSWGAGCTGATTSIQVGTIATIANTNGAYSGSAVYICPITGAGSPPVATQINAVCTANGPGACSIPAGTAFGGGCSTTASYSTPYGTTTSVAQIGWPTTGSADFNCSATGVISYTNVVCSTGCQVPATQNWIVGGNTCTVTGSGSGAQIASGATVAITGNAAGGITGTATLSCNNGVITVAGAPAATCAPAAHTCVDQDIYGACCPNHNGWVGLPCTPPAHSPSNPVFVVDWCGTSPFFPSGCCELTWSCDPITQTTLLNKNCHPGPCF